MLPNKKRDRRNAKKQKPKVALVETLADELICRVHVIRMSNLGSELNPTVRILLVTVGGRRAIYEGWGPLSTFQDWIDRYLTRGRWRSRKKSGDGYTPEAQFSTVKRLHVSPRELRLHGFVRVDRLSSS